MTEPILAEIVEPSGELVKVNSGSDAQTQQMLAGAAVEAKMIEMMFICAQNYPRDLVKVDQKIQEICTDRRFCEHALYKYSRGGTEILGASIRLIEEIANAFGRLKPYWEILYITETKAFVRSVCIDYESLNAPERKFIVDLGEWVKTGRKDANGLPIKEYKLKTDERDIRERVANIAQRQMRTQIEACVGKRIIWKAVDQVIETLEASPDLAKRTKDMVVAFEGIGVTAEMLCKYLNIRSLDNFTAKHYPGILGVWNAIKAKEAKVEDYFDLKINAPAAEAPEKEKADAKPGKPPAKPRGSKNASAGNTSGTATEKPLDTDVASDTASTSENQETQDAHQSTDVESPATATINDVPQASLDDLFG